MAKIMKKRKKKKHSVNSQGFLLLVGISLAVAGVLYYVNSFNTLDNRSRAAIEESPYYGKPRGYFTTPKELGEIKKKAESGVAPHASNVKELLTYAGSPTDWPHGSVEGNMTCEDTDAPFIRFRDAAHKTYAKALAYHLTRNEAYANDVKTRLLDLTDVTGFEENEYSGANKCILELSWLIPSWIQAADLLEEYPGWTSQDKRSFQVWLNAEVYKKVAWSSRVRNNNWGSAGSATAMMIADYLWDSRLVLEEVSPITKTLTPAKAYAEHRQIGLDRLNNTWKGDSQCTVYGIQPHGGIPDELRRGSTGCLGTYIVTTDSSYNYQNTHLEGSISHAEFLYRRGDDSMYMNSNSTGGGSIKNAIYFVIANPLKSYDWVESKKSTLHMAQRYYQDSNIQQRLDNNNRYIKSGYMNVFGKLTHGFAAGEVLGDVPIVPPPSSLDDASPTPTATDTPTPTSTNTPTPIPPTNTPIPTNTPTPTRSPLPTQVSQIQANGDGLWVNYYNAKNFTSYRMSRIEKYVMNNWGKGSPDSRINNDNFSMKWTGYILAPETGSYTFYVTGDDGEMLRINGDNIIENWKDGKASTVTGTIYLIKGSKNPLRLEYYENRGDASIKLEWSGPGFSRQVVPQKYLYTTK